MAESEGTRIGRKKWGEQLPKERRGTVCHVSECGKAAPHDSQLGDERNGKIAAIPPTAPPTLRVPSSIIAVYG
jgi:hypothetical protein